MHIGDSQSFFSLQEAATVGGTDTKLPGLFSTS